MNAPAAPLVARLRAEIADLRQQLAAAEEYKRDAERYRKIANLIGNIFVHGNFKAETYNERELEKLLREVGCFWETLAEFDAAIDAARTK